ncbi:hypothetical protein [Gloeomargarita lithophora]|uniref:hypothetical protein n=1 Tax=Gloeomargarita lithophora TaxID=1188228 RepID=UPI000A038CBC|nr:hypothetical protein [Gloeomargarita lithophora]
MDTALLELDEFFMEQGRIFQTLRKLSHRLQQNGIDYAIVGGIALFLYGYKRSTQDINILLTKSGLLDFQEKIIGRGFMPMFPGAQKTFRDTETNVRVEFLIAGEFPGDGRPKPISFPDPQSVFIEVDDLRIINLKNLIELKLASGLSAPDRLKDLADVQELIRVLNLPETYGEQLDNSVRSEFLKLWEGIAQSQNSPIIEYE